MNIMLTLFRDYYKINRQHIMKLLFYMTAAFSVLYVVSGWEYLSDDSDVLSKSLVLVFVIIQVASLVVLVIFILCALHAIIATKKAAKLRRSSMLEYINSNEYDIEKVKLFKRSDDSIRWW